ncbi:MAG TPA: hypothetical protein VG248_01080 [Caulobacteraceae bacterium]|jgi:hypothetical protein|nr:hypothetical protein [Caulobacteraceae bacterium]
MSFTARGHERPGRWLRGVDLRRPRYDRLVVIGGLALFWLGVILKIFL